MLADRNSKGGRQNRFCLSVTLEQKQTIMHYQPLKSKAFLRITVATPNLVTQTRGGYSPFPTMASDVHMWPNYPVMDGTSLCA